jgi:hypothetical protein
MQQVTYEIRDVIASFQNFAQLHAAIYFTKKETSVGLVMTMHIKLSKAMIQSLSLDTIVQLREVANALFVLL